MISEKDMENAVAENPAKFVENGLKLIERQHRIGSYIFDLFFQDRHGAKLIVEIQKGTLDRNHTYKILDYYDEYKENHPLEFVELMVIANKIPEERRKRLSTWGVTFKEISIAEFQEYLASTESTVQLLDSDSGAAVSGIKTASHPKSYALVGERRQGDRWDHHKSSDHGGQIDSMIKQGKSFEEIVAEFETLFQHPSARQRVRRHVKHLMSNTHPDFPYEFEDGRFKLKPEN